MKMYKGFNKDMTCLGFQYKEGETYTTDKAELCESGFHACENPLDTFYYYPPGTSVYHEVKLDGVEEKTSDDSKQCGTSIKIGAELNVLDICKLHFDYVKNKTGKTEEGKDWSSLAAQDGSSLAAQDWSSLAAQDGSSLAAQDWSSLAARNRSLLAAQDWSSLAAQDGSSLAAGKDSVIAAFNSKAKGDIGTLIALANRERINGEYKITDFKAAIVDGQKVKSDTWYTLQDGEFKEVTDDEK